MKRYLMTLGASAAMTLAFLGVPAAAGAITAASANSCIPGNPNGINSDTPFGHSLHDNGQGNLVSLSLSNSTYCVTQDGSSKWYEIQETPTGSNQCLDIVGISGGYGVNTEPCNFRSAELWWFPSGTGSGSTQIINQYGTNKLLMHDACLWNATKGISPQVKDCQTSQPGNQLWFAGF